MQKKVAYAVVAVGLAVGVLAACGRASEAAPTGTAPAAPTKPVVAATPMTPAAAAAKARAFLQHQIDSAKGDGKDLVSSFTTDAIILVQGASSGADRVSMWGIGDNGPDGATTKTVAITKLVAAGTTDAVWFYADVTTKSGGAGKPSATRVVELIVASEKWRAVAASFGAGGALQTSGDNMEVPNATGTDGPLAKLLASTTSMGSALDPNAIVVGPADTQLKQGAGAQEELAKWKLDPITLYQRSREVHMPTWGFVQAYTTIRARRVNT